MTEELKAILLPSRFYEWAQNTQPLIELESEITLIEEGLEGRELLLLVEGKADITSERSNGDMTTLAELESPALLGEMSFLEGRPTVANVIGRAGSRWIRISFDKIREAISDDSSLAADVYTVIARKLSLQLQNQNSMVHRWLSSEIEPLRKILLIFAELNDLDIDWMSQQGTLINYNQGELFIEQGQHLDKLWVVLSGEADIYLTTSNQKEKVGSSRRGEMLGEMALLSENGLATANVVARNAMQLLVLPHQLLIDRMETDSSFGTRFYRALAMLLSHRCRDQLMRHGLASRAAANEAISFDTLENISQAGRRFDWLCRQLATA